MNDFGYDVLDEYSIYIYFLSFEFKEIREYLVSLAALSDNEHPTMPDLMDAQSELATPAPLSLFVANEIFCKNPYALSACLKARENNLLKNIESSNLSLEELIEYCNDLKSRKIIPLNLIRALKAQPFQRKFRQEQSESRLSGIISAIDVARPYMTSEQAETVNQITSEGKQKLTKSDILQILSIIITIIFGLLALLPNRETKALTEQNEALTEQNEALTTAIDELTDVMILLQNEIEILSEENDNLTQKDYSSSEPHHQNYHPFVEQSSSEIANSDKE